jgi:hypothetical protein
MSMAIAQLMAGGEEVLLDDVACVATSFPSFFDLLDALTPSPPAGAGKEEPLSPSLSPPSGERVDPAGRGEGGGSP